MEYSIKMNIAWEQDGFDEFEIEVNFEYEEPSYTDHPYGSTYAREYHPATADIISITLLDDVYQHSEDMAIMKKWLKGTSIEKIPGWREIEKPIIDQINEKIYAYGERIVRESRDDLAIDRYVNRYEE